MLLQDPGIQEEPAIGLRLLSSCGSASGSCGGILGRPRLRWFNSSAQTCCGQPVRPLNPLLAWARGRRKAFMLLLPRGYTQEKGGERDRFKCFMLTQVPSHK